MKTTTTLLAAGVFLAGLLSGFGQNLPRALPETAHESVTGTPGVATKRAVMNFSELARNEALARDNTMSAGPAHQPTQTSDGPTPPTPGPPPDALCPTTNSPTPDPSFFALGNEFLPDWAIPPDTMGAVGPNHLMVTLNHGIRIQNRAGGVVSTVSPSNFWSALGPFNTYTETNASTQLVVTIVDLFDPRLLYDPYANRWIVSMTGDTGFPGDAGSNSASLFIGVSQTSEPTGNWNLYRIDVDATDKQFLDHPTLGFNKDWIVARGALFDIPNGTSINGSRIWAFNKTNLYAGGGGLYTLFIPASVNDLIGVQPAQTYDTNLATMYLMSHERTGNNQSSLRMSTITGPIGLEVFTQLPLVTTTNRWDYTAPSGFGGTFGPQLGSTNKFTLLGAFLTSLIYRNGSLWTAQTTFLPAGGAAKRSAVQWWQISPRGQIIQRGILDDPTGVNFYGFPSLGVNKFSDVLIGYNRFSTNQYASANYAFRAANDRPNTLRPDTVLKAGEATYFYDFGSGRNFWGDYSASVVDPVNGLDLWTIQEYPTPPAGGRDQWGTWWGRIVPPTNLAIQQSAGPNPVLEGQNLSYTVAVNYTGPTNVTGVSLTNLLPPGVTLLSITSSRGSCTNFGGMISCDLGSFANGDSANLMLVVSLTATNDLTNTVRVLASECGNPITNMLVTLVKADTDRDGLPDDWELANGLNQNDPSDAPLDSDGDGVINFREYLAGTNPTNSASVFRITAVTRVTTGTAPGVRVSFGTVAGRFYRIERTENLGSNVWVIVSDELPGTGGTIAVTDPRSGTEAQRYYRVGVLP